MDTCSIIWDALAPEKLSSTAKKMIKKANEEDGMIFCEISLWEIAMLIHKKRLDPSISFQKFVHLILSSNHYHLTGITPKIAELSTTLPNTINTDPANRIIAATTITQGAKLLTADNNLRKSKMINTVW